MKIRPFTEADAEATIAIFQRSIRELARKDYTRVQLQAWSRDKIDVAEWTTRRRQLDTFVADQSGVLAGFSDVDEVGYIDMMFVNPDFARQGVATALLAHATVKARSRGCPQLSANVSLTARPFFERSGFIVLKTQHPEVSGVELTNFHMVKRLE